MSMADPIGMNPERDELREWLADLVENQGVSVTAAAKESGISRSVLSLYLHGHRPASTDMRNKLTNLRAIRMANADNNESHEPIRKEAKITDSQVSAFQEHLAPVLTKSVKANQNNASRDKGLLLTEDLRQVLGVCGMCLEDGEIGVVIGPAGSGKTTALKEFCRRESRAIYIRADITMSAKELLLEIGSGLSIDLDGSRRNMIRQIVQRLKFEAVLVIVDEADLLVSKESVKKLEILRSIWDEAQTGVVLAGPPRLATFLVKGPGGRENLSQFYSRVRRAYTMKGVSRQEVSCFLDGIAIDKEAAKYLGTAAISKANGGLRRFSRLLHNAQDLTEPGETITLAIVKEADSLLVSPRSLGLEF